MDHRILFELHTRGPLPLLFLDGRRNPSFA